MKAKGSAAERELVQMFWGSGFAAIRAAGSGVSRFYCPDVLAGNSARSIAVECKSTKGKYQYFDPEQVRQLVEFAKTFGAEPWFAVKFSTQWKFYLLNDLKSTKQGNYVVVRDEDSKSLLDMTRPQNSLPTVPV